MDEHLHLPNTGRLSTISAMIIFGYTLLPFMRVPARSVAFSLFGFLIEFRLNFYYLVSVLTAAMAAFGMDWLLHDHPSLKGQATIPHMILPALTAAALGLPLGLLEVSTAWWVIMTLGSLLLILVLVAEYISIDTQDVRYPLALMVLSGISYSLFLIIAIVLRSADLRLYLMILILPIVLAFFCLRILQFRLGGGWRFQWTAAVALIFAQVLIALYYWPLSPVRFGLLLLGPVYALIGTAASLVEKQDIRKIYLEPFIIMGVLWLAGIFIG